MTRNLTMDTNINRYNKPVKTSVWGTELPIPNAIVVERKVKTTAAEVGWNLSDITEPSRWQDTAVTTEETGTVAPTYEWDRPECYITENATGRDFARKSDQFREPMPDRAGPVVTEDAPADGTGVTVMPGNYLEISGPRIPGVFLQLAEEARTIVIVDGQSVDMRDAQPLRTGWTRPVFVTEIINSPPILKDDALVATGASTEMMTNIKYVGQSKPIDRADRVVSPGTTEQPVSLGLNADVRVHASADTGGPDVYSGSNDGNITDLREMTESDRIVVMENRKFTNTALPVFSGTEGWYQHIHIVQAIVKSNGWPDKTAALQLSVHLRGEALNVALLLTREVRESWTGLMDGLTAYYQSPGRLAGLRRRFKRAVRQPGLDPATFATDLGMLAIQGFSDMKKQARDTMIRDRFIASQGQCALRRQLDGFAQGTPIGEIVDCCRVWESHSDSDRIPTGNYDSEVGRQSSDSRTGERRGTEVTIERREPVDRWAIT